MSRHAFKQVDVFTRIPFLGNPVAVVLDAEGLDSAAMQRIANWTNLSETTFVLPATEAGADYRVRIFTPGSELPFAGHPTIGTAHALLEAGKVVARDGRLVQQCEVGLVRLRVTGVQPGGDRWGEAAGGNGRGPAAGAGPGASGGKSIIAFDLPPPSSIVLDDDQIDELQSILGKDLVRHARPRLIDVGARWIVAQLADAAAVLSARPDRDRMVRHDRDARATGVVIFGALGAGQTARVEVRAFAPSCGVDEDPVCGSGNGCMAVFLRETGQAAAFGSTFIASQGQAVGRAGRIHLGIEPDRITVGGEAVTCIDGTLTA